MAGLTLEAWIRSTSSATNRSIVSKFWDPPTSYSLRTHYLTPGLLNFSTDTGAIVETNGTAAANDNAWHHVAGVYDGASQTLYVDLGLEGTTAQSGSIRNSPDALCIGNFCDGSAGQSGFGFEGDIDEVAVYNRALTDAQRTNSFCATQAAGGVSPLPPACEQ